MYGVKDIALNWFASYLHDRKFQVCINSMNSETKSFNYSVPQGSCSGASSIKDWIIDHLQNTLLSVHEWMCQNRLKMNPNKAEFILFGGR